MVIGHEAAAVVTAIGSDVRNVSVGDRVAIEPGIPCSKCVECREGRYNLCADISFWATPPYHGCLAR
jgi:D-xylulose reductase